LAIIVCFSTGKKQFSKLTCKSVTGRRIFNSPSLLKKKSAEPSVLSLKSVSFRLINCFVGGKHNVVPLISN
jgi:hypothetical protein